MTPQVMILLGVGVLLLTAGLAVLWLAGHWRRETGVPQGRIVYDDTGAWQECPSPLFSQRYLLAGKPDYIVARGEHLIPVEVKPRRTAGRPYLSDVLQLAAYCLLVEDNFEGMPPYGILKYATATFPVEYTPQLRRRLLATMESMRHDLTTAEVAPIITAPGVVAPAGTESTSEGWARVVYCRLSMACVVACRGVCSPDRTSRTATCRAWPILSNSGVEGR